MGTEIQENLPSPGLEKRAPKPRAQMASRSKKPKHRSSRSFAQEQKAGTPEHMLPLPEDAQAFVLVERWLQWCFGRLQYMHIRDQPSMHSSVSAASPIMQEKKSSHDYGNYRMGDSGAYFLFSEWVFQKKRRIVFHSDEI